MDYASKNEYLRIVKYLFHNEIKPTSVAIDLAFSNGYFKVVKYLKSKNNYKF